ncbi:MAG: (deoxy)nucleoside triphosphate pyrophosphohydrolase [Bacteroidota bacterium]
MDIIKVVCGIIWSDDKIFVCRRRKGKSMSGYWEFPGGKIESGESQQEALKRELWEELEMKVEVGDYLGKSEHDYGSFIIELYGYHCSVVTYKGKLSDHDSYQWVTADQLSEIGLTPADIPLAKMLAGEEQ